LLIVDCCYCFMADTPPTFPLYEEYEVSLQALAWYNSDTTPSTERTPVPSSSKGNRSLIRPTNLL